MEKERKGNQKATCVTEYKNEQGELMHTSRMKYVICSMGSAI